MRVQPGQANEIIAQVGALLRSTQTGNPLNGLRMRKMILAGTSASAGVLINYLPAHMVYRLGDMKPIYDGFLPTSNGTNIRQIDVPMIQVPTTTEASRGNVPTRQDGDRPGDQFRVYEFPGMPHLDTRDVEAFRPNPCKNPITLWPMSTYMSVALHHLVEWIDKGTVPPRADRILVDRNTTNDGSLIALDEHGNPKGGIRNPYVDVPVAKYGFPNEGAVPPTPNTVPWVSRRTVEGIDDLCHLTGYQIAMTAPELKKLYGSKEQYVAKVRERVDELTRQGWSLPVYRNQILADAAKGELLAPRRENRFHEFLGNRVGHRRVRIVERGLSELHRLPVAVQIHHAVRARTEVTLELCPRVRRQRFRQIVGDEVGKFAAGHWNVSLC